MIQMKRNERSTDQHIFESMTNRLRFTVYFFYFFIFPILYFYNVPKPDDIIVPRKGPILHFVDEIVVIPIVLILLMS